MLFYAIVRLYLTPGTKSAGRTVIEEIVADAIAQFHPDTFWPTHPCEDGAGDSDPSFYKGAAAVLAVLALLIKVLWH